MFKLFKQMKEKLTTSSQPKYRQYTHSQLKVITMRTRIVLQELHKKQSAKISQKDSQFKRIQASQGSIDKQYEVLQEIGKKVIETQSIKLLIEMVRKIETYAPQIINTKGDVSLLRNEINWFQVILWHRRCKNLSSIEEFNTFCNNFFKGVDITQQLNMKCELFKVYEQLKYLQDESVVPMDYLVGKVIPHVSFQVNQEQLEKMRQINNQQIRNKEKKQFSNVNGKQQMGAVNPFDIIGRRLNEVNYYTNDQQNNMQSNTVPNPFHPISPINQNFIPQNQQYTNSNPYPLHQMSQIPFLPPPESYHSVPGQAMNQTHPMDEQFAADRLSRASHGSSNPNMNNITPMGPRKDVIIPVPPLRQKKEKSFRSSTLNLIDWQAMYQQKEQQKNPYINSSKMGLLDSNDYSSSTENQYDAYSLPYPPSGVIPVQDVNSYQDHQFYVDTLDKYNPQPAKNDDDSFIKGIQSQFFQNDSKNKLNLQNEAKNKYQNEVNKLRPSVEFNQQDLIKELQNSSQFNKQPKETKKQVKSLNRLFGMKMVSNLPKQINPQEQNQKQLKIKPVIVSKMEFNDQIDNILSSDFNLIPDQRSEVKKIQLTKIDNYLKDHPFGQQTHPIHDPNQNDKNKEQLDKELRELQNEFDYLQIDQPGNEIAENMQQQGQNINKDIQNLIKTHKKQIQRLSGQYQIPSNTQTNDHQPQTPTQNQTYQYEDNQRFDSSTLRYSQASLQDNTCLSHIQDNQQLSKQTLQKDKNITNNQESFNYEKLQTDLIDSLNIIRRQFGRDIVQIPQPKQSSPTSFSKKPYMRSIYARDQYISSQKDLNKSQNL